jgi:hypothetical protein
VGLVPGKLAARIGKEKYSMRDMRGDILAVDSNSKELRHAILQYRFRDDFGNATVLRT